METPTGTIYGTDGQPCFQWNKLAGSGFHFEAVRQLRVFFESMSEEESLRLIEKILASLEIPFETVPSSHPNEQGD